MQRSTILALLVCAGVLAIAAAVAMVDPGGGISGLFAGDSGKAAAAAGPVATAQAQRAPQPVPAAKPGAPQRRTETINYDNWVVTCTDTGEKGASKTCSGALRVVDGKSGQTLFAWIIGRDNEGVLRTVMNTPTGVLIQKGVALKFGNSQPGMVQYVACTPQQCEASIVMVDAMLKEARSNDKATATIHAIDGRAINFEMPIKGIDKVLATLGAK